MTLLLIFCITAIAPSIVTAQEGLRIIRFEKAREDDDEVYLELLSVKVGDKDVALNEPFLIDQTWLKDLKLRVKNVSGKTIECAYVSFGILEGINDKLEPQMSWGWKWSVSSAGCVKDAAGKHNIGSEQEVELNSAQLLAEEKRLRSKRLEMNFHQAEFIRATVYFRGEMKKKDSWGHDSFMRIGPLVKYSEFLDN